MITNIANKKKVTLVQAKDYEGNPIGLFVVDDEPIKVGDGVCEKLTNGDWMAMTIHNENDLDIKNQKRIVATSEQIGYFDSGYTTPQVGDLINTVQPIIRDLTKDEIKSIFAKGGECYIAVEQKGPIVISGGLKSINDFGGKGLTHHTNIVPKFVNGKIIISYF